VIYTGIMSSSLSLINCSEDTFKLLCQLTENAQIPRHPVW